MVLLGGVVIHRKYVRHLQHEIRIESQRIVSHTYKIYDMSYTVGRLADLTYDMLGIIVY